MAQTTRELVKSLYRDDEGRPFELTDSQIRIFEAIFKKEKPRVHVMTYTQYGKSEVVSLAVLTRVSTFAEKWVVVAPTTDKARIIMSKIIQHIFDNGYTLGRFQIGRDENMDRIRRERSKTRLTFKTDDGIGEVYILSAEAGRKGEEAGNKLMGFGSPNVVEDESGLIPDPVHDKVMRMMGGHKENFLVKIGNPFYSTPPFEHFYKSSTDPRYDHIVVDGETGVAEGRMTREYLNEMKEQTNTIRYGILYECKFPPIDVADDQGYMPLIFDGDLKRAFEGADKTYHFGEMRLGCDIAGSGSNYSVIVKRSASLAEVIYKVDNPDVMSFTGEILRKMQDNRVEAQNTVLDAVAIGEGPFRRLKEQGYNVVGANVGSSPLKKDEFDNLRAEAYWRLSKWLRAGGKLKMHPSWNELLNIKYKVKSDRKIQIKPKLELLREGIASPDVADALMLTFVRPDTAGIPLSTGKNVVGVGSRSEVKNIKGVGSRK